ncbi:MAG: hypothetical protein M3416_15420 [Acidobacteriota bacterium]|nr:hypothetical protein [Acidobacteriota bacterium]
MSLEFAAGDDLVFQVESGFGLMRVIGVEVEAGGRVWHVLVYEDFYPDVEAAEGALASGRELPTRLPHVALTEHAFAKTPAARLGHRPVTAHELEARTRWERADREVHDRSVLLMLGMR